ncbi:ATP-binding cassette domain-containing protein [Guggenheimella bovis]
MLLEVKDLTKEFTISSKGLFEKPKKFLAVDHVTFQIKEAKTFGLVGESGSGKSTISNMIAGILKPTSGEILYEGVDILKVSGKQSKEIDRNIQMVFQDPYNALNPSKKIGWIVEEPLRVYGETNRREKVLDLLSEVGLDESILDRYPHELSGGQRQRVVIMTAIILKPKLVILDEAVSALDVSIQAQILNLLKELQRKYKLSYLFISHDLQVVEYMSDAIAVLKNGRIVELASAKELNEDPIHPYTQSLLAKAPMLDVKERFQMDTKPYENLCRGVEGTTLYKEAHYVLCDEV